MFLLKKKCTDKNPAPGICLPIIVKFCQNHQVPYNYTIYPNYIGHFSQIEAEEDLEPYEAIVDVQCYELASLFLCTLFVPKCGTAGLIPPCKSLCLGKYSSFPFVNIWAQLLQTCLCSAHCYCFLWTNSVFFFKKYSTQILIAFRINCRNDATMSVFLQCIWSWVAWLFILPSVQWFE